MEGEEGVDEGGAEAVPGGVEQQIGARVCTARGGSGVERERGEERAGGVGTRASGERKRGDEGMARGGGRGVLMRGS